MKDETLNLYTDIHHGAKMGIESIDALLKSGDDEAFKRQLLQTQNKYKKIAKKAEDAIQKKGEIPHEIGVMSKLMTHGMVAMSTMTDASPEKESKMIINGFDMAVKELSDSMQKNVNAEEEARDLAFYLLEMQQEELKKYRETLKS